MSLSRDEFESIKELPLFKGKVVSGSMIPVIQIGEEILIEIGSSDLKRFDIIVIYQDEKLICHYLWQMNKRVEPILLQTRNMSGKKDFPIEKHDYLGKVLSHKISFWRKMKLLLK